MCRPIVGSGSQRRSGKSRRETINSDCFTMNGAAIAEWNHINYKTLLFDNRVRTLAWVTWWQVEWKELAQSKPKRLNLMLQSIRKPSDALPSRRTPLHIAMTACKCDLLKIHFTTRGGKPLGRRRQRHDKLCFIISLWEKVNVNLFVRWLQVRLSSENAYLRLRLDSERNRK